MHLTRAFRPGDLVWFDPGVGYVLPGEVVEFHRAAQVITVQALINNVSKTFTLNNLSSVKSREDLGQNGVEDMVSLSDLNEASVLWNLRIRYDNHHIYTYVGSVLVAVNPLRMFDIYGLDHVNKYDGQILGTLSPHLFAVGAAAYHRLLSKNGQSQVLMMTGESGAGKTESAKLITQYLAAVNKSPSNLITEQILEALPMLESFGNAKTTRNDNSSRFGKFLQIVFKDGVISGAKLTDYLLEKSRIVSQISEERNYHIFYELLHGLPSEQKEKYGLMTADKYFYLNQGGTVAVEGKNDKEDFETLQSALQVLSFSTEECETIYKILAAILHLGNIYFHRKQLKHGYEGVEIGSEVEIKWGAHLLQLSVNGIKKALTMRQMHAGNAGGNKPDNLVGMPLNIDQALDARDAIAKALYSSLFTWLMTRINKVMAPSSRRQQQHLSTTIKNTIGILDLFGFEDFAENSFEQLCVNYANESLQYYVNKIIFKSEQAEYAKEKIEWTPIGFFDNHPVLHILSKKPVGIFHLLDDESNFPKASDLSFLEKCHYNHALNELYSRPRMSSMEFGVKHFAGQVWYNVEGFLDKNRDTLRYDVMALLISSKDKLISKMFLDLHNLNETARTMHKPNGQFITMKPRTPTVSARFQESLGQLLGLMSQCHPHFVRCIKPNSDKTPMKFDMPLVLEQLRYMGMLETIKIRKTGYPVRMKYLAFAQRYRCLLDPRSINIRGAPTKEIGRIILENFRVERDDYAMGSTKVFMRENLEAVLEKQRQDILEVEVLKLQRYVRGYLARHRYEKMKESAICIQSAYRGYCVRKKYSKVLRGVVALQAVYRMKKQQSIYGQMKSEMQKLRKREMDERMSHGQIALEQQHQRQLRASSQESRASVNHNNRAVASVNHLEVPAELAFVFSKMDNDQWEVVNAPDRHLGKMGGPLPMMPIIKKLPHDIDYFAFSKVANIYFKSHLWQMKREPIKTPFLPKQKESDYFESLALFKLILRFMNDNSLSGMREKIMADYIAHKGIQNEKLRDEIFCQLANQTWKNDNEANGERGWLLLAHCLSAFAPSKMLHKYLLKYVSDHGHDGYKWVCQQKLLKSGSGRGLQQTDQNMCRNYPPSILEWRSNKKRVSMSLAATCVDGETLHSGVESSTVAEDFAAAVLDARGLEENELNGWSLMLENGEECVDINGGDYVLDAVAEMELPPSFPGATQNEGRPRNPFLVSVDHSKGTLPLIVDTEMLLREGGDPRFRSRGVSASPERRMTPQNANRNLRARSHDRALKTASSGENNALGLSRSVLNERYFEDEQQAASKAASRSKSLDNLTNPFGLSGSKLNRRYRGPETGANDDDEDDNKDDSKWTELGLSTKSTLNDRYFSQPDLLGAGKSKLMLREAEATEKLDQELELEMGKHRHGHPRFVKSGGKLRRDMKSSAMSDTSEAPSIASHVHRVRVPSQASDVDQFLDDLFSPVLDGQTVDDGLSDAKSLAASMRGGGEGGEDMVNDQEVVATLSRANSINSSDSNMSGLVKSHVLAHALQGNQDDDQEEKQAEAEHIGFQPIQGQMSPIMSPPPMLMPTPILGGSNPPSMTSPLMMPVPAATGGHASSQPEASGSAMAFTYVPVPVYNMAGMTMPGVPGAVPGMPNLPNMSGLNLSNNPPRDTSTPAAAAAPAAATSGGSPPSQPSSLDTQQAAYQQAFLQNAVAQNMQIQQQLMLQNQALTQLLQQSGSPGNQTSTSTNPSSLSTIMGGIGGQGTPSLPSMIPMAQYMQQQQNIEILERKISAGDVLDKHDEVALAHHYEMKQRSLSTPNTPRQDGLHPMDPYSRARTVRIGKWRWPPPKEELAAGEQSAEGFFEFKMRKMSEKRQDQEHDPEGMDEMMMQQQHLEWSQDDDEATLEDHAHRQSDSPSSASVGKLKLTSQMKEKLEAVTGGGSSSSRKNSIKSTNSKKSSVEEETEIGVLAEKKKLLMEQKLGAGKLKKWDTVDEVHKSIDIPEAPKKNHLQSPGSHIPLPPPPPPTQGLAKGVAALSSLMRNAKQRSGNGSPDSSAYSPDGSLPDPSRTMHGPPAPPPPPIKPGAKVQRHASSSTQLTTEKYDLEESSEFLQPIDDRPLPVMVQDHEDDYQALEEVKTQYHPPNTHQFFTYNRVPWTLKIRKEIFSPSETVHSALAINLIFCQIVTDVFSPLCIRLSSEDRSRMKTLLDEYHISLKNIFSQQHKISTKKSIIEVAKEFPTYFARLYPVSSSSAASSSSGQNKEEQDMQYLAISHSGIRLVRREKSLPTDYLQVLETYSYEDIGEVSTVKNSGLQLAMHTGGRLVVTTPKAGQIRDLINQYLIEANSGQYDYVKALAEFSSKDESALTFKKGEIIAVVPKHDAYTEKGWLYGIKDGRYGLFPSDFVERMSPQAIRREMRVITNVTRSSYRDHYSPETNNNHSPIGVLDPDYDGGPPDHGDGTWDSNRRLIPDVEDGLSEVSASAANVANDGKHPLLEFAMRFFREGQEKFDNLGSEGVTDHQGSLKDKSKKGKKKKSGSGANEADWTWKDRIDMVKWTDRMITHSLLRLERPDLNKMALECFASIMRYMGDLGLLKNQHEVNCVETILMYCHKFEPLRDEVYCQIMKQTTNNKSGAADSCQKGWRLFSIIAAYFNCSEVLKPYLFKYLETSAYDKRRAYHGTALVCLHNLRKTFKYGGRKNVPSIEEITAISAGRNSKRQIYRLPGGTERIINTKSTTVVEDIIDELCNVIGVSSTNEMEEFSLYCIVEGETFTVPLAKDHYILDVTTELQRDGAIYYLIFCRSVWHYPLRLDNTLYIEVVFNQIAPDYLEGLLLVMPGEQIEQEVVYDIAKVAALLHRAADMDQKPSIKETKFLLPKPALSAKDIKPPQWVNMVQSSWEEVQDQSPSQAKAQVLEILSVWPLFGSSFFAVRREGDPREGSEHILALNKNGVSFLDLITHETLLHYPFTEVISTRKVQTDDGTLFLDMKCGNLMQQRITRIQTEQANEIARLIKQYITIDQRMKGVTPVAHPDAASEMEVEDKRNTPSR